MMFMHNDVTVITTHGDDLLCCRFSARLGDTEPHHGEQFPHDIARSNFTCGQKNGTFIPRTVGVRGAYWWKPDTRHV